MADFLWHKVSEKEKDEIKKQAKEIMEQFSKKLSKVGGDIPEGLIEKDDFERVERGGKCLELNREIMFENALNKNKDFIVGERKGW